ncbi:hypothetical protein [Aquiflexum sp.]|uniref:hypothetical protein n=1 Tax=Aquiflexum sp. TaxID=1872584 RepID=UPI003593F15D
MDQHKNENRNPQHEDRGNQKTNQESGRNDLNPTDRDERDTEREFNLDDDKERNLDVNFQSNDSEDDRDTGDNQKERKLPPHEDPNINADNESRQEKFGTMRNQPNKRSLGSEI